MKIAYDKHILQAVLGGGKVDCDPESRLDCITARVITDSARGETSQSRFTNARSWVKQADEDGYHRGRRDAAEAYESKIRKVFGI